ncbi:MAG: TerC family protein [Phycisphaeraceae bacterium]|nr:TerC family protein [Phycisphaerales bacterium]QOJ18425.1 MAG: TerC family protein [Phycisphaeraceae bacterium]
MLIAFFAGFVLVILVLIALDLGLIGRKAHVIGVREALLRTAGWVTLALSFNVLVYFLYEHNLFHFNDYHSHHKPGKTAALQFFMGYLLEQSLSVDNMFVIATIFAYFRVPLSQQHRVLFWGIMGALILRGVMIALGAVLIARFHWMVYVFGVLLLATAAKMLLSRTENIHPDRNLAVRIARRLWIVRTDVEGSHFFVKVPNPSGGLRTAITPMFLALILVETSDVMFAIDSIPAIFAVTSDPFIVFTSNVFAICGLRSLYFALAGLIDKFRYLKLSLVFLLAYVGVKMMWNGYFIDEPDMKINDVLSLSIIGGILTVGVLASIFADRREARLQATDEV